MIMIARATHVAAILVLVGGLSGASSQMIVTMLIPLMVVTRAGLKLGMVKAWRCQHITAKVQTMVSCGSA